MKRLSTSDTIVSHDQWLNYAQQALEGGGELIRPGRVHWDVSNGCENPLRTTVRGIAVPDTYGRTFGANRTRYDIQRGQLGSANRYLDYDVPCRRCGVCLRRRAHYWRLRALAELAQGGRTWFGTMTFGPKARQRIERRLIRLRETPQSMSNAHAVWTRALATEAGKEITLWLKRVRKESGAAFRYLLVCEAHKDGWPHFHALLHEAGGPPVRHRTLAGQWAAVGFSNFKLVDDNAPAHYVAKYLSKDPLTRVRASVGYGHGVQP